MGGAALLDAFGRSGADKWQGWAGRLADRFRTSFWVEDAEGPYPAMALDRFGTPVDAVASNMGHLLGTGILDADETDARRPPDRLARTVGRLRPAHHVLPRRRLRPVALPLRHGLAARHRHHDPRPRPQRARAATRSSSSRASSPPASRLPGPLPELWGGDSRWEVPEPVPYPAACRPQAWAAASVVILLTAVLGLQPDVPHGTLDVRPSSRLRSAASGPRGCGWPAGR